MGMVLMPLRERGKTGKYNICMAEISGKACMTGISV
mgnify:CR=1 FL=1